jgi:hypothetical protein
MRTINLRKHVGGASLSLQCRDLEKAGKVARLGGLGPKSTIWGLPGQKLPAAGEGVDMDAATPRAKKKVAKRKKAVGGGATVRRKYKKRQPRELSIVPGISATERLEAKLGRRLEVAKVVAGRFRPAIAHDGALLLSGAAQAGELNSAETRVLVAFLLRLDRTGARA